MTTERFPLLLLLIILYLSRAGKYIIKEQLEKRIQKELQEQHKKLSEIQKLKLLKTANKDNLKKKVVESKTVPVVFYLKLLLIYHIKIQDQDQPDYTIQYYQN